MSFDRLTTSQNIAGQTFLSVWTKNSIDLLNEAWVGRDFFLENGRQFQ